jgi:ankyrin repeat protein
VKLLVRGGASIESEVTWDGHGSSALSLAALYGEISIIKWLLEEGKAAVSKRDGTGDTALHKAARRGYFATVQWLLEHGKANIAERTHAGERVWDLLWESFLFKDRCTCKGVTPNPAQATALLRVMVLQSSPPAELTARLTPEHKGLVRAGMRLQARLPAYLERRRALLNAHCPVLLPPLRDLVHGYMELTATEELWATGLGVRGANGCLGPPLTVSSGPDSAIHPR